MSGVLRMAAAFLEISPLQRWLNIIGALLLAGALAIGLFGGPSAGPLAVGLSIMGLMPLLMLPVFMGGAAMRIASTPSVLHLRPGARVKMLLAATLVVTALAALCLLPGAIAGWLDAPPRSRPGGLPPAIVFQACWAVLALAWITVFAISFSRYTYGLVGLIPVTVMALGRVVGPVIPSVTWLFVAALCAWLLFCAWYLRVDRLQRPVGLTHGAAWDGREYSWLSLLTDRFARNAEPTKQEAQAMLLIGGRPGTYLLIGCWVAIIFVLVHLMTGQNPRGNPVGQILFLLPFNAFYPATLGYYLARRARLLWLRTGMDRHALFQLTERIGVRQVMLFWCVTAAVVAAYAILANHIDPHLVLRMVASQFLLAAALAYVGTALVRDWSSGDVLLAMLAFLAFVATVVVTLRYLREGIPTPVPLILTTGALAVSARHFAAHRWRTLDWRIARLPHPAARSTA